MPHVLGAKEIPKGRWGAAVCCWNWVAQRYDALPVPVLKLSVLSSRQADTAPIAPGLCCELLDGSNYLCSTVTTSDVHETERTLDAECTALPFFQPVFSAVTSLLLQSEVSILQTSKS